MQIVNHRMCEGEREMAQEGRVTRCCRLDDCRQVYMQSMCGGGVHSDGQTVAVYSFETCTVRKFEVHRQSAETVPRIPRIQTIEM